MSMTITTGDDRDDDIEDETVDRDDDRNDSTDDRDKQRSRSTSRDDDGERDDDTDDDEDKSPEELKAEIKRLRSSLSKANSSGNRRRQQLKELRSKVAALDDAEDDDSSDEDADEDGGDKPKNRRPSQPADARLVQKTVDRAVKRRERELEEAYRRDIIDTRAESALIRAGVNEKNIRLLKRELDYDELELLKDRTVDGLEEEIDRLRGEFGDLFRRGKTGTRRINGGDDRDASRRGKPQSASEKQAAALRGNG